MDKDIKTILLSAGIVILIIFGLIYFGKFIQEKKESVTVGDKIKETLDGKESETNFMYNGFVFIKIGNMWHTEYQMNDQVFKIPLHFNPREVEDISITGTMNQTKFNTAKNYYITFDPLGEELAYVALSAAELSLNLATAMDIFPQAACTVNETDACSTRPIVTCDSEDAVIYLKSSNTTQITLNSSCLTIEGKGEDLVRSTDRLIYQWYGIMK